MNAENLIHTGEQTLTHGLFARCLMKCARCVAADECEAYVPDGTCALEVQHLLTRRRQLAPLLDAEVDGPLLDLVLWYELRVSRAARALAVRGELTEDRDGLTNLAIKTQGVVNTLGRLYTLAGLTPAARLTARTAERSPLAAAILSLRAAEVSEVEPE